MKVHFKRLAAAAAAVAMSLSLNVSAFAAEPTELTKGTLVVSGEELQGKTVTAVRMFSSRATVVPPEEPEGESTIQYDSYVLEDAWVEFFTAKDGDGDEDNRVMLSELQKIHGYETLTAEDTENVKAAAAEYVASLWNGEESSAGVAKLVAFAQKARVWAYTELTGDPTNESLAALKTEKVAEKPSSAEEGSNAGVAKFEDMTPGYYLVFPEGGSFGYDEIEGVEVGTGIINQRGTDAILVNVPNKTDGKTEVNIKSSYPTVDKTVDDDNESNNEQDNDYSDDGTANVGDTVEFKLTSFVPDMTDYENYYFKFVDTLTGLAYDEEAGVTVKFGSGASALTLKSKENSEDVEVTYRDNTLTIDLGDLKALAAKYNEGELKIGVGWPITVTYQATITVDALKGDAAKNDVHVEYGNNPDDLDKSTPDESDVYSYELDIHKYGDEAVEEYLSGAKFVLSEKNNLGELHIAADGVNAGKVVNADGALIEGATDSTDSKPYLIGLVDTREPSAGVNYRVAAAEDKTPVYVVTTNDTQAVTIDGLEGGKTYYLYEVEAPTSYNKLKAPIKVEVIVDPDKANERFADDEPDKYDEVSFTKPLYVVNDAPNNVASAEIMAQNKTGVELPETGSIGTIGLTVAGVVIVAIGLFAMPRKKKDQD